MGTTYLSGKQLIGHAAGGVGTASSVRAINQLLAGVHLCAAAEALAFAKKKGMNLHSVLDVVAHGAAYSYMMVDRTSSLSCFV